MVAFRGAKGISTRGKEVKGDLSPREKGAFAEMRALPYPRVGRTG